MSKSYNYNCSKIYIIIQSWNKRKNQNNKRNYLSFLNVTDNVMQLPILNERFLARTAGKNESGHVEYVQIKTRTDPRKFSIQQHRNRPRLSGKKEGRVIIYGKEKKITNRESTTKKKENEPSKLVLSRKLPKKYQILDSCVILITHESCNSLIQMVMLKTQKSKIRPSAFFSLTKLQISLVWAEILRYKYSSFSGQTFLPPIVLTSCGYILSALRIIIRKQTRNVNIFQFLLI